MINFESADNKAIIAMLKQKEEKKKKKGGKKRRTQNERKNREREREEGREVTIKGKGDAHGRVKSLALIGVRQSVVSR